MLQGNRRDNQRRRTTRGRTGNGILALRIRLYNDMSHRRDRRHARRDKGAQMSRKIRRPTPRLTANPAGRHTVILNSNNERVTRARNRPRAITTNRLTQHLNQNSSNPMGQRRGMSRHRSRGGSNSNLSRHKELRKAERIINVLITGPIDLLADTYSHTKFLVDDFCNTRSTFAFLSADI